MTSNAVVMITLGITDQRELGELLTLVPKISLNCGAPRAQSDGTYRIEVFGTAADAEKLAKTGRVLTVDEDFGARTKAALASIGHGDRFRGGTIKPTGLGVLGRRRRSAR